MTGIPRCPRCGAPLTGVAGDPCPACLLQIAVGPESPGSNDATRMGVAGDDATRLTPAGVTQRPALTATRSPLDQIGPYRIVRVLGEGGMGVVYLAEQSEPIRRTVALKVIKLGMDTRDVVGRFESERQALALMDHTHIARVIDAGATPDGRPFFVMEYVAGVPITEYCDAHRLPTRARLELVAQVCAAIQHAHQKGVIHRDLKPSNVLVTEQDGVPAPKIIDFGIAKATDQRLTERTMFTEAGQFMGTPEYMSPEQTGLAGLDVDATTDIYSLGVLLYELLVGRLPFDPAELRKAGYAEMQRIIREVEPPRPSTRVGQAGDAAMAAATQRQTDPGGLRKTLSRDLDWITLKALEKDRARRYQSASEFAADIARYLNDEPVEASPPSAAYRAQKFVRRNRLAVTAAGLVFAAVVAGLIVSLALYVKAERSRIEAERNAYAANILAAEVSLRAGDVEEARRRLSNAAPALRSWEWHYLDRSIDSSTRVFEAAGPIYQVAFTPDGRSITAQVRVDGTLRFDIARIDGDGLQFATTEGRSVIAGSRDGRFVLTSGWLVDRIVADSRSGGGVVGLQAGSSDLPPSGITLRDTKANRDLQILVVPDLARWRGMAAMVFRFHRSGELMPLVSDQRVSADNLSRALEDVGKDQASAVTLSGIFPYAVEGAFSPDGRRVAAWSWSNTIYVWEVPSGRLAATLTGNRQLIASAVFTTDGRRLISSSLDGTVVVWDLASQSRLHTFSGHAGPVLAAAVSTDGQRIASIGADQTLRVWSVEGRQEWSRVVDSPSALAMSPDGRLIATGHTNGGVRLWNAETSLGVAQLRGYADAIATMAFNDEGDAIVAASDRRASVWNVKGASATVVGRHDYDIGRHGLAWATDGRLASTSSDLTVRLWPSSPAVPRTLSRPGARPSLLMEFSGSTVETFGRGLIATGAADGLIASNTELKIEIWDALNGRHLRTLENTSSSAGIAFEQGGTRLFGVSESTLRVWDVRSGKEVGRATADQPFEGLAISSDNHWLVTPFDGPAIGIWDTTSLRMVRTLPKLVEDLKAMAVSVDGTRLATLGLSGILTVRDFTSGRVIASTLISGSARALAYHPSGTRLAVALEDGGIRLFDAATLEPLLTLRDDVGVHANNETWATFVPPGLAKDEWFRHMAFQLAALDHPQPTVETMAFSPDGMRLGTGWSHDGTVRVFDATPRTVDEQAQSLTTALLIRLLFADDVIDALQSDDSLGSDAVRNQAIRLVRTRQDDPKSLNSASWVVVKTASAEPAAYRKALARAQAAVRLSSADANSLNTLALAQYRVGDYQAALAALATTASMRPLHPDDRVVDALVRLRLGQLDAAREDLAALKALEDPSIDLQALLREANALADSLSKGRK